MLSHSGVGGPLWLGGALAGRLGGSEAVGGALLGVDPLDGSRTR